MKIQKVTVRILLYGIPISYMFLSSIKSNPTTFIPIGRMVTYSTGHNSYTFYADLPRMQIYRSQVKILDEDLFRELLEKIAARIPSGEKEDLNLQGSFVGLSIVTPINPFNLDRKSGVQIQYVDAEPIINSDNGRVRTLVHGQTPRQENIRAMLDVIDQLHGFRPRGSTVITFYSRSQNDPRKFFITQLRTPTEYAYDGVYLYFISKSVGKFKYNLLTGNISFELEDKFKIDLAMQFKLNYPSVPDADIRFNVIAIEPDVTMATITYS